MMTATRRPGRKSAGGECESAGLPGNGANRAAQGTIWPARCAPEQATKAADEVAGRIPRDIEPRPTGSRSGVPPDGGSVSDPGSVTMALADLRASDARVRNDAAQRLWERFAPRLCALARSRLNARIRVREDEDDIVQSLFLVFFAAQRGDGASLRGREDFWRLMVRMTLCKVANVVHHHQRARRDVRREQALMRQDRPSEDGYGLSAVMAPSRALSPQDEVISRLELERILSGLDEAQRRILTWKLEGFTNAEIGREIHRTERTVELKLRLIRRTLASDPGVSQKIPGDTNGGK
jgi:RNA polymerase sigma-70 factor, ECF subfamily